MKRIDPRHAGPIAPVRRTFASQAGTLLAWGLWASSTVALGACELTSTSVDVSQCNSNADCSAEVTGIEGLVCQTNLCIERESWACLETSVNREFNADFAVEMRFIDSSSRPVPGVELSLCGIADLPCDNPLGSTLVSDDAGIILLTPQNLPIPIDTRAGTLGFSSYRNNYLEARFPGENSFDYMILTDITRFFTAQQSGLDITVVSPTLLSIFESAAGTAQQSTAGLTLVEAFDCNDLPASGLRLEAAEGQSPPIYLDGILPAEQTVQATTSSGNAFFLNTPVGLARFTAVAQRPEPLQEISRFSAFGREQTVTYVLLYTD